MEDFQEDKNKYSYHDTNSGSMGGDYSFEMPQSGKDPFRVPIDSIKDLGGIPLPEDNQMGKWGVVITIICLVGILFVVGRWVDKEFEFKNAQIKACNANFQELNLKYILKDQELQQYKNMNVESNTYQYENNNNNNN